MNASKKSPLFIIFLTICIDLIGFGIIIPLSPYLARSFNASGLEIGLLMFTYAGLQLCFAPVWGYFSDLFGRRPILLLSLLGSAVAHFYMAFSSALWMLFLARALAGFFGASISVATAYIADVTRSTDRAKNMGIIGAAFGLGFVLGPAISGGLSYLSSSWGFAQPFAIAFPALGASFICFVNLIFAYFQLPETLSHLSKQTNRQTGMTIRSQFFYLIDLMWKPNKKRVIKANDMNGQESGLRAMILKLKKKIEGPAQAGKQTRGQSALKKMKVDSLLRYIRHPILGKLLMAEMLLTVGMGQMEATLALFLKEVFFWSVTTTSFAYVYIGIMMALTHGFLIRKLMPLYGEKMLLLTGIIASICAMLIMALSFFTLGFAVGVFGLGVTILALGNGCYNPALLGIVSLTSQKSEQGRVMGIYQSYMSIGRMIGAVLGGFLFDYLAPIPYFSASFVMLIALFLIVPLYSHLPDHKNQQKEGQL